MYTTATNTLRQIDHSIITVIRAAALGLFTIAFILFWLGQTIVVSALPEDGILANCQIDATVINAQWMYEWPHSTTDAAIIDATLALSGERMQWDATNGFAISERLFDAYWFSVTLSNGETRHMKVAIGAVSNTYYVFAQHTTNWWVADYGGVVSPHVTCGGWIVDSAEVEALADMFRTDRDTPPNS
jgi:hypothetical protein